MGLVAAIAEIRAALEPAVETAIPAYPPDQLSGEWPMLLVYPQPTSWVPAAHGGSNRRPVISGAHEIVVEWHVPFAVPSLPDNMTAATAISDAIPVALWVAFKNGAFGGAVTGMTAVRCETYGQLNYGGIETFGVRFIADVTIQEELTS